MKPIKALILGLLLLVPILVFVFISVFGTHHFSLKTYYPKLDNEGKVVHNVAGDTVFQQVPAFNLEMLEGGSLGQQDLDKYVYVAHFTSSACERDCWTILSQLVRVQEAFANIEQVKLVTFAMQDSAGTNDGLQQLAKEYKPLEAKWYVLTGDTAEVAALAAGFKEPYMKQEDRYTPSNRLVLVDKEKEVRGVYLGTDPEEVDRLVLEINVLLDEYSKRK